MHRGRGTGTDAGGVSRAVYPLARPQRQSFGRCHRVARRARSRRMKSLAWASVPSPIPSPMRLATPGGGTDCGQSFGSGTAAGAGVVSRAARNPREPGARAVVIAAERRAHYQRTVAVAGDGWPTPNRRGPSRGDGILR